ncbi:TRAP transporter large permease [Chloroflexota bacterium]
MSAEVIALIVLGGLILLLALGVEVAVAMGVVSSVAFILFIGKPQIEIAWSAWIGLNSFTLVAMPLFVFMGTLLANTGAIRSLFSGADKWIGGMPGGLVSSVLVASGVFGAMSGSSIAAAATFSVITVPEMERRNYDPKLSIGAIAAGGGLSVLIPPSVILILFGAYLNQSVARLFAAALIPGIILTILFLLTVLVIVSISPKKAPRVTGITWRERFQATKGLLPWVGVVIIVLGVIFGGIMTPTEASALGAVLAIVVAALYRVLTYEALKKSLLQSIRVAAMIGFILITGKLLGFVMNAAGLTQSFSAFMINLPFGKYGIFAIICLMYIVLGMFFDAVAMLILTIPFVMPVMTELGFDPFWWGVVYVVLVEIGLVTPPFGLNLFTIQGVLPRYSLLTIAYGALPFLIPMVLMIVILVLFPELATWLPSVLY